MTQPIYKCKESDLRFEFEQLWKNHLSMLSPLDSMSPSLRDKFKEFSWQTYLEGSIMTQNICNEMAKEEHYKNCNHD